MLYEIMEEIGYLVPRGLIMVAEAKVVWLSLYLRGLVRILLDFLRECLEEIGFVWGEEGIRGGESVSEEKARGLWVVMKG